MHLCDAHIHLDQYPTHELERLLGKWQRHGVKRLMCVSSDLRSCEKLVEWKRSYPDLIHIAFGFHPEQPLPTRRQLTQLFSFIYENDDLSDAIGEVGLPHYRLGNSIAASDWSSYEKLFTRFARLAAELQLPLIIHAVHDKAERALDIVQSVGVRHAHFHWLKAPESVVRRIVQAGYYISVTPEVCYRERDRALVESVPLRQLLVETDGPWPYRGEFKGRRTSPLMLKRVTEEIAIIKNRPIDEVRRLLQNNYHRLFVQ